MRRVWMNGAIVPVDSALVPLWSETALRGANAFDGIRGYWNGSLGLLALSEHLDRLFASAATMGIEHGYDQRSMREAIREVLVANPSVEGRDVYVRPSICVVGGRSPGDPGYEAIDYVSVSEAPRVPLPATGSAIVSTHRRPSFGSLPPAAKCGGAYLAFRLPTLERVAAGVDHVIVLNEHDAVAEAEGAAVMAIRDGSVVSPPPSEGGLDSITRRVLLDACGVAGIPVEERRLPRAELASVDGLVLAGTLCEVVAIHRLDDRPLASAATPVYRRLVELFDGVRGGAGTLGRWRLTEPG
jgi:branched-chain amino acid aminotransferase